MFRPNVTVERYYSISKRFYMTGGSVSGKAERAYRLSSDRFLSRGNCIIREMDRLVGETSFPDLAAKNKHEFTVGEDADIVYKENVILMSSNISNVTYSVNDEKETQLDSTFEIHSTLKNYKNRPVKVEYQQYFYGDVVKLFPSNAEVTLESSTIKYKTTLASNDEKSFTYKLEIIK